MWWNWYLLFYMCLSMMGLTRCYKTAVFTFYYFNKWKLSLKLTIQRWIAYQVYRCCRICARYWTWSLHCGNQPPWTVILLHGFGYWEGKHRQNSFAILAQLILLQYLHQRLMSSVRINKKYVADVLLYVTVTEMCCTHLVIICRFFHVHLFWIDCWLNTSSG